MKMRSCGPMDLRTYGPAKLRTCVAVDLRSCGPADLDSSKKSKFSILKTVSGFFSDEVLDHFLYTLHAPS